MTPKLRFPQFQGAWHARHGRDAFMSRRSRGLPGLPLYSVTLDQGMVRRDSLEREFASNATDESNLRAEQDDLVYNMMRMWQGAVGRAPEECIVSPAYVVLAAKAETSPRFFEHWFQRKRSVYWLWAYSHGLTSDRLRLYFRDFSQVPMSLPSREEQEKIADFLGAVDERVRLLRQRQEVLEQYKRGVMQRIFAQTLRFKRDDGADFPDWVEMRLGDVARFTKGKGISKDDIITGGALPCIRYGELYTIYAEKIEAVVSATNVPANELLLSQRGDVILPASGETPLDMASACCVLIDGVALGGDLTVVRSSLDGLFLAYLLRGRHRRDVGRLAQGNSVVHLYGSHLAKLKVSVPPDGAEQRKIADFLSVIDDKIAAVAGKIAAMQTFKKGLLQQMFV